MAKFKYSRELCRELVSRVQKIDLRVPYKVRRYEDGDRLELAITTAWPEREGRAVFQVEKFVGGGFAGQVYRSRLESLEMQGISDTGLTVGERYAVKILIPPSRFSAKFRDIVYLLAFQAPFSAQVLKSACRAGLLWPKVLRMASREVFGDADAIADTYASFYDPGLRAFGEVREWVEGRTWRLESDTQLGKRRAWRTIDPHETESPEYISKHQFMVRLVDMLHEMGAPELARQYEWTTLKSQPNALKRTEAGNDPTAGLCAVDFRAGLALVPFLPMSPGDFGLIIGGLRRGSLAQFDRCDFRKLRGYVDARPEFFGEESALIDALETYDSEYRRSMPDVTHQGLRLLSDPGLRHSVREGMIAGYWSKGLIDETMRKVLASGGLRFALFYFLGALPLLGRFLRKLWGNAAYRSHVIGLWTWPGYLRRWSRGTMLATVTDWHRGGRVGEQHARVLTEREGLFWLERCTIGVIPIPVLHRVVCEPKRIYVRIRDGVRHVRRFFREAEYREQWLRDQVEDGYSEGMLHEDERDAILAKIKDPFIAQYLKSVGVHLATLPVTQIVSVIVGLVVAAKVLAATGNKAEAAGAFAGILILFQFIPISPGSLCRGLYVVYLMIRDRNFKDYMVAAPLSFVKYIGYLAFPLQMATAYPAFSQFMASRWATGAVHIIPVFGEKGALLEHFVFDLFFNVPRVCGRWAGHHIKGILNVWLLFGLLLAVYVFCIRGVDWGTKEGLKLGVNVVMWVLCIFVLPRTLFYPVLRGRRRKAPVEG